MSARRAETVTAVSVVVLVIGLLASSLTSCGGSRLDGLVVPVLWASDAGGTATGGIERARVRVGSGEGGFTVDLADSEAKGAGRAWLAASASAATVATLLSGVDPSTLEIGFRITGRIDGPSGGAALAVGVLAAIRGVGLTDGVTMTGTVSPDGFVGRVGSVPQKVRAAADNGFDVVLVPVGNAADRDSETGLDVVELGASLGIEVRPVADLGAAVAAFTGAPITKGPDAPPPLRPAAVAVTSEISAAMVARLADALAASGASPSVRAAPTRRLASARTALAAGDFAGAYGSATDGWLRLLRDAAKETTTASAAVRGLDVEASRIVAESAAVVAAADRALVRSGDGAALTAVGRLNLPAALGWLTYARSVAAAVATTAPTAIGADQLGALAGTLAEQRAQVEVLWPDAEAVVAEVADGDAPRPDDVGAFLDGYTVLLAAAARANERYVADVLGAARVGSVATDTATAATRALSTLVADGSSPEIRAAAAMSWWFITATQVAGREAFGLDEFGLGTGIGVPGNRSALAAAVRNASATVAAATGNLAERGVDTDPPVWSAGWGAAAVVAGPGSATADGDLLALGELWYAAVTAFLLTAATAPSSVGSK